MARPWPYAGCSPAENQSLQMTARDATLRRNDREPRRPAPVCVAPLPSRAGGVARRAIPVTAHAGHAPDPCMAGVFCLPNGHRHRRDTRHDRPATDEDTTITAQPSPPTTCSLSLADPDLTIVDVRPIAAYNGWRLKGSRGAGTSRAPSRSRAPGSTASTCPRSSACSTTKGITADRDIVVYGDGLEADGVRRPAPHPGDRARPRVRGRASPPGQPMPTLPIDRLSNYDKLVHIDWLRSVLDGERPEAAPAGTLRAVPRQLRRPRGVRRRPHPGRAVPRHELARGPGRLEPPLARGDRRGASRPRDHQRHHGHRLRPGHRRGRQREVARPPCRPDRGHAGVDDPALRRRRRRPPARRRVRLVGPGRLRARDRSSASRRRSPPSAFRCRCGPRRSSTSRRPRRSSPTRPARRWSACGPGRSTSAQVSGYNYIGPAGPDRRATSGATAARTPITCSTTATSTTRCGPIPEIAANWAEAGITADKWVAFYCGTGWRASETWFYA